MATGAISPTAGAAIGRDKNTEVAKKAAAKAVKSRAPVAEIEKQVRQKRGTPSRAKQGPVVFKVARGVKVTVSGTSQMSGTEIIDALRAATDMAVADFEQEQDDL